jgi:hypothetical protein
VLESEEIRKEEADCSRIFLAGRRKTMMDTSITGGPVAIRIKNHVIKISGQRGMENVRR